MAVSLLSLGGVALGAAAADALGSGGNGATFLLLAAVFSVVGGYGVLRLERPHVTRGVGLFALVAWAELASIIGSSATYLAVGTTTSPRDALFESVAGFTTTAMTVLDVGAMSDGEVLWRALTQWLGGVTGLLFAIVLLPVVAGGREVEVRGVARGPEAMSPLIRAGLRRVIVVYLFFSLAGIVVFLIVGLDVVDALAYALSTVSSGGFAPHADGFASLDNAGAEWVAAIGMFVAGTNLALLWFLLRGDPRPMLRSFELRVYGGLVLAATILLTAWTWDDHGSGATAIRRSLFTATSALSTTGYRLGDWSAWPAGTEALLLLLIAIGGMTGAAAGGFKIIRAVQAGGYARRELHRELHPRAVRVVRIGNRVADEQTLERNNAYQFLFLTAAVLCGFFLAASTPSLGVVGALSAGVSALATAGPILGPAGGSTDVSGIADSGQVWLMMAMVLGRFAIYPVLIATRRAFNRVRSALPGGARR